MKIPAGEFTLEELVKFNKHLQMLTVQFLFAQDSAKGQRSEIVRLTKMRGKNLLYSKRAT